MKKILSVLVLFLVAFNLFAVEIPDNEKCITETEGSPFKVSAVGDGIAAGLLVGSTVFALKLPDIINMPEYDEFTYDLDDVNFIDRKFARKYSKTLDHAGDATLTLSYCLVPGIYTIQMFNNNFSEQEGLRFTVIYAETILATQTVKNLLKTAIKRKRPYMYFAGYPEDELDNYDFEFSLPSGHTTNSFMNAAFLSYTFCKYYPESDYKIPVVATAYSLAFATAGLRMASGNHFFTDTLAGAALGTTIGFAVPWLHTLSQKVSTENVSVSITPTSTSVSFKF